MSTPEASRPSMPTSGAERSAQLRAALETKASRSARLRAGRLPPLETEDGHRVEGSIKRPLQSAAEKRTSRKQAADAARMAAAASKRRHRRASVISKVLVALVVSPRVCAPRLRLRRCVLSCCTVWQVHQESHGTDSDDSDWEAVPELPDVDESGPSESGLIESDREPPVLECGRSIKTYLAPSNRVRVFFCESHVLSRPYLRRLLAAGLP